MLKPAQKTRGRRLSPCLKPYLNLQYQTGVTMIEAMIALTLSVVVIGSMVALMTNSLGTTTRIIEMSQLTDELRNTMSMMSRDIRRANYSANNIYCYGNADCGTDGSAPQGGDITINASNDCFTFLLDRDWDGDATNDDAGGFRRVTTLNDSIGLIIMWVGDFAPTPTCTAAFPLWDDDDDPNGWMAITNPDFVDITTFTVNDDESFTQTASGRGGTTVSQRARQVQMILVGELIRDDSINRRIEDSIKVRNDIFL